VSTGTHLFLNWTHKLAADRLRAVEASLQEVNPRAVSVDIPAYATLLQELATTVQADAARGGRAGVRWAEAATERRGHQHPFGSAVLPLPATVDRTAFSAFVDALPEAVVRAKGLVRFADEPGPMYVWHRVPGKRGVRLDRSWPHAEAQPTALFIGVELPVGDLEMAAAALNAQRPHQ
jgi:G3E family GTPase